MHRLRGLLSLVTLLTVEALALATLWWAVHVPEWHVDWSHFGRWLDVTPQTDVGIGLVAWVGLVLAGWLAATTALYLLATATRIPALVRATSVLTLPGVKRIVEGVAAVGITASVVLPGAAAFAQQPSGGWASTPAAVTASPVTVAGTPDPVVAVAAVAPTSTQAGQWTVAPGDNLWDISAEVAAHQLGVDVDSLTAAQVAPYWQQVIALTMPHLSSGDANLIYAGEVVVLAPMTPTGTPADIVVAAPVAAAVDTPSAAPVAVTPVSPVTPVTAAPVTTVAPPATTVAPSAPAVSAPADRADVDTSAPLSGDPARPVTEGQAPAGVTGQRTAAEVGRSSSHATTWAGGGLLAAAVVLLVGKRRSKAARLRKPGEILVPAARDAMETERHARVAADIEGVRFVDTALRALAALVTVPVPEPIGFLLSRDTLTIVLAEAAVAPLPFRGRGTTWSISRSHDLAELQSVGRGFTMTMPAAVTLGRNEAGEEVVVDLEDSGMLSIVGPGAEEVVNAAAIQLAAAPWSTLVEVILVGFAAPPTGATVRAVESIAEVIDELEDRAERTAALLLDNDCRTTLEARMLGVADDAWVPTVVVCAAPPPDHLARRLVGLVDSAEAAGVAALVAGSMPDSPWEATITSDGLAVESLNTTVLTLQQVSATEAVNICDVLDAAAQAPQRRPVRVIPDHNSDPELIVNVYGAVTVTGAPEPTSPEKALASRGKALEALTYLACHPKDQVDGDRLMEALWPGCDPDKSRGTLSTTLWHVRQAVGRQHVPVLRGAERFYGANPDTVATTAHLIERALAASVTLPMAEAIAGLRVALEAVEGRPFDMSARGGHGGGRPQSAWEWAFAENMVRWAAEVAGDAAHRLHQLALDSDDADTAAWAVRQGLRADPENEQLRRDEMAVARARRSLTDLEAAMVEAERVAAAVDDGVVDPVTAAVYRDHRDAIEDEQDAELAAVAG